MPTQWDIENPDKIIFEPPLYEKAKRRKVILMDRKGWLIEGIGLFFKDGYLKLEIPTALRVVNRPELGNHSFAVSERAQEVLRLKILEQMRADA